MANTEYNPRVFFSMAKRGHLFTYGLHQRVKNVIQILPVQAGKRRILATLSLYGHFMALHSMDNHETDRADAARADADYRI
jgi:hypothetical protein